MTDGMIYKAVLDDIQSSNGNGVYAELTLQCTVKGDKQKYSTAFTFFNSKSKNDKGENAGQDLLLTSNMFHPTGGADYSFRIDGFPSQLGTATPDETNYSNEISLMTVSQMAGMKKLLLQAPMSNGPALFSVDTSGKEPQAVLSHCSGDIGQSIPLFSQIGKISEPAQAQSSAPTASSAVASSQAASEASSNPPDPAQNPDQRAPAQPAAGDTSPPN